MTAYADVIIDIAAPTLDKSFQYAVPAEWQQEAVIGAPVLVPFGNGKMPRKGYIVGLSDEPKLDIEKIKPIASIPKKDLTIEDELVTLAYSVKRRYGGSLYEALRTVIPVRSRVVPIPKRLVVRTLTTDALTERIGALSKREKARERLYRALLESEEIPYELVTGKLKISKAALETMEREGILQIRKLEQASQYPGEGITVLLNEEQKAAVRAVCEAKPGQTLLLHGITGSGKTEVYLSVIEQVLAEGKQVIVLIPEIALTYQTVLRFYRCFGERVAFVNSKMAAGERYLVRERAKKGEISIMIGPRSALFTPFRRLGLIVVDEEHETSYKSETTPRYQAVEVARERAAMCGAKVLLGSATPSMESYYRCKNGEYTLLTLTKRAKDGSSLPKATLTDMREELKARNFSVLGRRLKAAIEDRLQRHQQVMLFLNRRGYAGFVSCRSCGYTAMCPHCDISMTFHKDNTLRCHYCNETVPYTRTCPNCGSAYFLPFGRSGTQKIEELVCKEFPNAAVLRMDADTTKATEDYETILTDFAEGRGDILIGTQMIVKGHDFPNVTLVGVLAADLSLGVAEYSGAERTFDLIAQAAGRAGRDREPGEVIIQTYQPEHYAITAAAKQDFEAFYESEIRYRKICGYPPCRHMLLIQGGNRKETALRETMEEIAELARTEGQKDAVTVIGPGPTGLQKRNDVYRQIVYVKHADPEVLIRIKDAVERKMLTDRHGSGVVFDLT